MVPWFLKRSRHTTSYCLALFSVPYLEQSRFKYVSCPNYQLSLAHSRLSQWVKECKKKGIISTQKVEIHTMMSSCRSDDLMKFLHPEPLNHLLLTYRWINLKYPSELLRFQKNLKNSWDYTSPLPSDRILFWSCQQWWQSSSPIISHYPFIVRIFYANF